MKKTIMIAVLMILTFTLFAEPEYIIRYNQEVKSNNESCFKIKKIENASKYTILTMEYENIYGKQMWLSMKGDAWILSKSDNIKYNLIDSPDIGFTKYILDVGKSVTFRLRFEKVPNNIKKIDIIVAGNIWWFNNIDLIYYDDNGYDENGYNWEGYNKKGYSKDGYNKSGFDKNGVNKCGFNKATKPKALYLLAGKHERTGDNEKASITYQYIVDNYPEDDLAIKASDALLRVGTVKNLNNNLTNNNSNNGSASEWIGKDVIYYEEKAANQSSGNALVDVMGGTKHYTFKFRYLAVVEQELGDSVKVIIKSADYTDDTTIFGGRDLRYSADNIVSESIGKSRVVKKSEVTKQ